jgi:hypothetical protein
VKLLADPSFIIVHTEGTKRSPGGIVPFGTVKSIRDWHVKGNGWEDIGYHLVITKDGKSHVGRRRDRQGAGVEGFNSRALHICVTGNADYIPFNPKQYKTLIEFLAKWANELQIPASHILGHRECYAYPGVKNTGKTCPGKLTDMDAIRQDTTRAMKRLRMGHD